VIGDRTFYRYPCTSPEVSTKHVQSRLQHLMALIWASMRNAVLPTCPRPGPLRTRKNRVGRSSRCWPRVVVSTPSGPARALAWLVPVLETFFVMSVGRVCLQVKQRSTEATVSKPPVDQIKTSNQKHRPLKHLKQRPQLTQRPTVETKASTPQP
jgi:hypothetical protein